MPRALLSLCMCLALAGCDKNAKAPDADAKAKAGDAKAKPDAKAGDAKAKPDAKADAKAAAAPKSAAEVGKPAPDFELADLDGNTQKLSAHKGKWVVLEWFNPQCPFVKYSHGEGPLKDMAAKEMEQGVVWLSINSGAPGKQGHGVEANREGVTTYGMKNPVLLDEDGTVGHTYGALKTPHVFLVNPEGVLVYKGAIDNAPMGEVDGGDEYNNHLAAALADVRASKPVATPETKPYGCSVKYAKG